VQSAGGGGAQVLAAGSGGGGSGGGGEVPFGLAPPAADAVVPAVDAEVPPGFEVPTVDDGR
jgi:hypothetical protein